MSAAAPVLHLGGPPVIDMIDADHARTTRNLLFIDRSGGTSRSAVYTDELRRTDDRRCIVRCRARFIVSDGLSDRPNRSRLHLGLGAGAPLQLRIGVEFDQE